MFTDYENSSPYALVIEDGQLDFFPNFLDQKNERLFPHYEDWFFLNLRKEFEQITLHFYSNKTLK